MFEEADWQLGISGEWGPKRPKMHHVTLDLLIKKFFDVCKVPFSLVADLIEKNQITHWSAFIGASAEELMDLGFKWGPAKQIVAGVKVACKLPGMKPMV